MTIGPQWLQSQIEEQRILKLLVLNLFLISTGWLLKFWIQLMIIPPFFFCKFDSSLSDVFSLGLIALYCLDNKRFLTFKDKEGRNILNRCSKSLEKYLNILPTTIPYHFIDIVRRMLSFCPTRRPTLDYLIDKSEL